MNTRRPATPDADATAPEIDTAMLASTDSAPSPLTPWWGAVAGLVAGAVAVTIGMLVAGIIEVVSPIDAVGSTFIDHVPAWLKELAIRWFGTNDKFALRVGIVIVLFIASLVLGALTVRRRRVGLIGIAAFGVVGAWAAISRPAEPGSAWLPSIVGAIAGAVLLSALVNRHPDATPIETPGPSRVPLGWDRRRFLVTSGLATAAAATAGTVAQALERSRVAKIERAIPDALPASSGTSTLTIPAAATLDAEVPYITPNESFYRIDTALSFPRVDPTSWKLTIGGMVDQTLSLSYDDLLARTQVERIVTLTCVSNEVGGKYIGNAVWQGVLLKDLLDEAGVQAGVEQLFSTSLDGWTCGFPVAVATDGRDAMVALGMNGEALPLAHGFPARLVVPGLYGYVSATKWLDSIELTTWDQATGYWVPRGWAREAPVKTHSRIDLPKRGADLAAGPVKLAGIAWAQHRGIERVEVRVDNGEWMEATLAADVTDDSWRPWAVEWQATAGRHSVQVRATDKTGATQTEEVRPPAPDGATGYHTRTFDIA